MVAVKIYGITGSTCTQRVIIVCNELGINYELISVNLVAGEHQQLEYLEKMHPLGLVPVLEDEDGTKIYECRGIARYLLAKYGRHTTLMPDSNDLKAYAMFEQAASVEYSSFDPPAGKVVKERVINPAYGIPIDDVAANQAEELLKSRLKGYERILGKQKYLAGDHITLADLLHIPPGAYLEDYNPNIWSSNPNVKRWWKDISSRPSWRGFQ